MKYCTKWGQKNRVADSLSVIHCLAQSIPHLEFLEKFKEQVVQQQKFQNLVRDIQEKPEDYKDFNIANKFVFFKGKLFVPS